MLAVLAFSSCRDQLNGPPSNTPPSSDTVAYWTFDGNGNDVSGNRRNATLSGTFNYIPDRFGNAGKAIEFVGYGQMNVINMPNFTDNDSYTVSFWVNFSAGGSLLSQGYGFGADTGVFGAVLGGCGQITSSQSLGADKWRLITLAVSAHNSATLYIDTAQVAESAYGAYTGSNDSMPLQIAFNQLSSGADTTRLDNALDLHYCLSASQVTSRFHEGGWANTTTGWTKGSFGTSVNMEGICFPTPQIGYACGFSGTVLKSVDSGVSWTPLTIQTTENLYGISFLNSSIGVVAGDNCVSFFTRDGGVTWLKSSITFGSGLISPTDNISDIKFIGVNVLTVGGTSILQPQLQQGFAMTSSDSGMTWSIGNGTQGWVYSVSRMSGPNLSSDSNLAAVVGAQGMIELTDYGVDWTDESITAPDFYGVDFAGANGFAVGALGSIYSGIYSDATASSTWTKQNSGVNSSLRTAHVVNSSEAWVGGDNGVILHTLNDGQTWAQSNISEVTVQWSRIVARDAHHLAFVGTNGTLYWLKE